MPHPGLHAQRTHKVEPINTYITLHLMTIVVVSAARSKSQRVSDVILASVDN